MFLWIVLLVVLVLTWTNGTWTNGTWTNRIYTEKEGLTNPEIKSQMETNYDSITTYLNKIQGMVTHL